MTVSQTEENYLKAIYSIEITNSNSVNTSLLSLKMNTKASSVTDMVKKLAEKNLVNYQKYKGVSLTQKGEKIALQIIRKHRLWEVFLVDKLNYNWDEVHELAEQLEHINSNSLINRLEEYLNFPTFDPHGDPIPDKNGTIEHHKNSMLSSVEEGKSCIVVGIKDSSAEFLKFLDKSTIQLGSFIKVVSKESFDNSMVITCNTITQSISQQISKNLFIQNI